MIIKGLQKLTLLDFPERLAATVFLGGCNMRCPFCHNASLVVRDGGENITEDAFLEFLRSRQGKLSGVCITGGEPTLQRDLPDFIRRVRALGYAVKLDTNGTFPDLLQSLVEDGLVDFVAMDIKNSPARYAETCGLDAMDLTPIRRSAEFLLSGAVDYEFRTTVTAQLHDEEAFADIAAWLHGAKQFAIQNFRDSGDILSPGLSPCSPEQLRRFEELLRPHAETVLLRGDLT